MALNARTATKYLAPYLVVRATRILYTHRKRQIRKGDKVEIVLNICKPNYHERTFIKACLKAKEPFPIKKVVVKYPPKKK